jgi:hypothetical protein
MRRKLANIAGVTSFGLALALSALWVRSRWRSDTVYRQATPQAWSIASNDGGVTVGRRNYDGLRLQDESWGHLSGAATGIGYGVRRWGFAGFAGGDIQGGVGTGGMAYKFRDDYWTVPYWVLVLVASAYPLLLVVGRTRGRAARARVRNGQCPSCGYDLRASPERCPECGRSGTSLAA